LHPQNADVVVPWQAAEIHTNSIILFAKMLKFSINTFLKEQNFVKEKLDNIMDFFLIFF
jgi:hypothetical protein